MYFVYVDVGFFCTLIFPTRHYHSVFSGEDEDNDNSNILKCLLKTMLFYMLRIFQSPQAYLQILDTPFTEEEARFREVKYLVQPRTAGKWQSGDSPRYLHSQNTGSVYVSSYLIGRENLPKTGFCFLVFFICLFLFFQALMQVVYHQFIFLFSRKAMDYTIDRTWFFPYFDHSSEMCVNQWIT